MAEETVIEQTQEDSAQETRLFDIAKAIDEGEGVQPEIEGAPKGEIPADGEKPPVKGEKEPDTPEEKAKAARERGPDGKFKKAEKQPDQKTVEGEKPETEYAKAKKEEDRQRSLLANFEKEKQSVRAKEAELAQRERQLAQVEAQSRPEATLHGYTAAEYAKAANDFAKAGDYEHAYQALGAIDQIREFEAQYYAQAQAQANDAAFNSDMDACIKERAELADPNTPIAQAVMGVLGEFPELYYLKNGFKKAVQVAERFMRAESSADLEKKLETAEAEIAKLRSATQPSTGGPSKPVTTKKAGELSYAELERIAAQADAEGVEADVSFVKHAA
jgi:hypothetical protein